ncbi:MAG: hypothetical protein IPN34_24945 [Planctomycetes bacterium]|nr:hypothetical protein [Planctomycetota bacterium]
MDRELRELYNRHFSTERYASFQRRFEQRLGMPPAFRLAESPVFWDAATRTRFGEAARGIMAELEQPALLEKMRAAVPERFFVRGEQGLPTFALVDFAVARDASGAIVPRLIELQGFPSLFALKSLHAELWQEELATIEGFPSHADPYFGGLDHASYRARLRQALVGEHDPSEVVLVDVQPEQQKTKVDFVATELLFGVRAVCLTELRLIGKTLHAPLRGKLAPVKRIYNRLVFDELASKGIHAPFAWDAEIDVEWAPHPNWYWKWSKYTVPHLRHPSVPKTTLLSELSVVPPLERYVLKPLFSFSGVGVNVDPTPQDLASIPAAERSLWCLQEKVDYAPAMQAADGGGVKIEVRMMFIQNPATKRLELCMNLCRLSRGKMLGVDFNKDFSWVGSSVALCPVPEPKSSSTPR